MQEKALVIEDLCKTYRSSKNGDVKAVDHVSFDIDKGEVFALIGPNGAGKTTTIRMVATLLKPTSGNILVDGIPVAEKAEKVREVITYLPDEAGAYKSMTGIGYLQFMASLFTADKEKAKEYVDAACSINKLGDRLKDKIGSYSRGMIRKLLLSRAVMTRPALAILDEPTSGLDIINALDIRRMIRSLAKEGMSFLVSSHNMLEIEYVSDKVGIINKGKLLAVGKAQELKQRCGAENLEEVFEKVVSGDEVF